MEDQVVFMVDQVDLMVDLIVDLMEDNFKEERLGSTWMVTWEAPSGVNYLYKMYE